MVVMRTDAPRRSVPDRGVNSPVDTFVAAYVGSPKMNLIAGN